MLCGTSASVDVSQIAPLHFFEFTSRPVYANSLLAALNARNIIRGQTADLDELSRPTVPTSRASSSGRTPNISIKIDTMQQYAASEMALDQKEMGSMVRPSCLDSLPISL